MGLEIERKFLVKKDLLEGLDAGIQVEQAYLSFRPEIRIRKKTLEGVATFFLTIKGEGDLARSETEVEIGQLLYSTLKPLAEGTVIIKRRHLYEFKGHTWEIDVYQEPFSPLVIAEIELETSEETVERPIWVGEEVTYNKEFKNANLARSGLCPLF